MAPHHGPGARIRVGGFERHLARWSGSQAAFRSRMNRKSELLQFHGNKRVDIGFQSWPYCGSRGNFG